MIITKARFINKEQDGVLLTFSDNSTDTIPTFESKYKYTDLFNEWKLDGGIVEDYRTSLELLDDEKIIQKSIILNAFVLAEAETFLFNGKNYNGGAESAKSIYARINLVREDIALGATTSTVRITDIDNLPNDLTITEALTLAIGIADLANTNFLKNKL